MSIPTPYLFDPANLAIPMAPSLPHQPIVSPYPAIDHALWQQHEMMLLYDLSNAYDEDDTPFSSSQQSTMPNTNTAPAAAELNPEQIKQEIQQYEKSFEVIFEE